MGKLTLEKIAELTGVSRSTVSRVVNDHPNVKSEVRERVQKTIIQTGYHPNPAARSLASHRSNIIGLLIPQSVQYIFTDPYYPRVIQGITQACNAHDYTLSLFLLHNEAEEIKLYQRILHSQLFDGLIITSPDINDPFIPKLLDNQIPFVIVGRHHNPQVSFIDVDNLIGAYNAVIYLIRMGHQRIATITGYMHNTASVDRLQGYKNALHDRGFMFDETLVALGDYSEISGYEAMQRLIPYQPDAVFVASDTMALGTLRALRDANISVPHDISVIGFDDLPVAMTSDPLLTTVRQPIINTGTTAVETLLDILCDGPAHPRRMILPTELVVRASTQYRVR